MDLLQQLLDRNRDWAEDFDLRIYGVIHNPRDGRWRGGQWIAKRSQ